MKFSSKIVTGHGVGRELGFPTLNFKIPKNFAIEPGVYAARLFLGQLEFPAILFFGKRETFDSSQTLEIHVLEEFKESPTSAEFEVLQKIRDTAKFNSKEKLSEQIQKDVAAAREILGVR
ncbi:MAG: riboflavin kinase [Candidatus Peribacteraceae bacterium]|nr:riboflavin kinase [Candidatus Peribacteraceae bacterium]